MTAITITVEKLWEGPDAMTVTDYTFPVTEEFAEAVFEYAARMLPEDRPPNVAANVDWSEDVFAYAPIYENGFEIGQVRVLMEDTGWELRVRRTNTPEGDDAYDPDHIDWRQPSQTQWLEVLAALKTITPIEVIRKGLRRA